MAYVNCATWIAKEGQEDTIVGVIEKMTLASRQESGCLFYPGSSLTREPARVLLL